MGEENGHTRKRWLVPVIVILIVFFGFSLYQWVIPRTNLEIRSLYHESPAGGGTGGSINLNVLFTNWGNREITEFSGMIIVRDHKGIEVARNSVDGMVLSRGDNAEVKLSFIGSQYKEYSIHLDVEFSCSGSTHERTIEHVTIEDQMNLVFVDNIR